MLYIVVNSLNCFGFFGFLPQTHKILSINVSKELIHLWRCFVLTHKFLKRISKIISACSVMIMKLDSSMNKFDSVYLP